MSRKFTIIFQALAMLIQVGNASTSVVPPKYHHLLLALVAVAQAVQGLLAHNYNPDGTPAVTPYVPPGTIARVGVLILCTLLAGCAGNADVIKALATDQATICVKVTTIYGTLTAARTNISAGDVTCDALTVKASGSTSLPVTVVPSAAQAPIPVQVVPVKP